MTPKRLEPGYAEVPNEGGSANPLLSASQLNHRGSGDRSNVPYWNGFDRALC